MLSLPSEELVLPVMGMVEALASLEEQLLDRGQGEHLVSLVVPVVRVQAVIFILKLEAETLQELLKLGLEEGLVPVTPVYCSKVAGFPVVTTEPISLWVVAVPWALVG